MSLYVNEASEGVPRLVVRGTPWGQDLTSRQGSTEVYVDRQYMYAYHMRGSMIISGMDMLLSCVCSTHGRKGGKPDVFVERQYIFEACRREAMIDPGTGMFLCSVCGGRGGCTKEFKGRQCIYVMQMCVPFSGRKGGGMRKSI